MKGRLDSILRAGILLAAVSLASALFGASIIDDGRMSDDYRRGYEDGRNDAARDDRYGSARYQSNVNYRG